MDFEQVRQICQTECQLDDDRPVLVGVSGGPDSLCLLDVLRRCGYAVVAACFDHGMRAESAGEVDLVEQAARKLGAAFVRGAADVPGMARDRKLSLEEAARTARYQFLFEQARAVRAQAVAVGHTADDQVETVLMHLLRGAGLAGLKGMLYRTTASGWDADLPLVRPLLGVWRSEIEEYCRASGLEPIQDMSNLNQTYFRNRLRHDLIPYLKEYNPKVKETLWRTARVLAGDLQVVEAAIETAWQECAPLADQQSVRLPAFFQNQPVGMQRALLRRAIAWLRPTLRDVDFDSIERGVRAALSPAQNARMDLLQGLRLIVDQNYLTVEEENAVRLEQNLPRMGAEQVLTLTVPGDILLENGWSLHAEAAGVGKFPWEGTETAEGWQVWLDAEQLEWPLSVRTRRPGDRFAPLGMGRHSLKLSDFFINERVPRAARDGWPLVFSGDVLAWVPLYRQAEFTRLVDSSRSAVCLSVQAP